jgi:hypothetical protein
MLAGEKNVDPGEMKMPMVEIRVKGQIDQDWSDWLEGLKIDHTKLGETVLKGPVENQSVLFGLLDRLAGLGLQLISVNASEIIQGDESKNNCSHKTVIGEKIKVRRKR